MVLGKNVDHEGHVPAYVKIIIIAQAVVILAFTIGMYQEYVNNSYLQQYVISLFASNLIADALLSMITVSVFAIGTFTILGSMSTTKKLNKQWKTLSEATEEAMDIPAMPVLEKADPVQTTRTTTRRSRQRRTSVDKDNLFRSMTQYAEEHKQ